MAVRARIVVALVVATIALGSVGVGAVVARSHREPSPALLPDGFATRLLRRADIAYSHVTAVSEGVREAALRAASRGASPVVGRDARPIVVRVRFTDNGYRDHGHRLYVDRPALMLIFPDTPIPLSGPPGSPDGTVASTVVDFIDPDSLHYLRAVSFSTASRVKPYS